MIRTWFAALAALAAIAFAAPALAEYTAPGATATLVVQGQSFSSSGYAADTAVSAGPHQRLTTELAASTSLTVPTGAKWATLTAETQGVRFTDDGSTPTSTDGLPIAAGATVIYRGNLAALLVIRQASGAVLHIYYYK